MGELRDYFDEVRRLRGAVGRIEEAVERLTNTVKRGFQAMASSMADLDNEIATDVTVAVNSVDELGQKLADDVATLEQKIAQGADTTNEIASLKLLSASLTNAAATMTAADQTVNPPPPPPA